MKSLKTLVLLLVLGLPTYGQAVNVTANKLKGSATDPSGTCKAQEVQLTTTGVIWVCASGTWTSSGGSGGASINSTNGTIPYRSSPTAFADSPLARIDARTTATTYYGSDTSAANFRFRKAYGTSGSPTVVLTGRSLGAIEWQGYDGDEFWPSGKIDIYTTSVPTNDHVTTQMRFFVGSVATPSSELAILKLAGGDPAPYASLGASLQLASSVDGSDTLTLQSDQIGAISSGPGITGSTTTNLVSFYTQGTNRGSFGNAGLQVGYADDSNSIREKLAVAGNILVGAGDGTAPAASTIRGASYTAGLNNAGVNLTLKPGNGTGTGGSGSLVIQTATPGSSSSTANTYADALTITALKNIVPGSGALATNATDGFVYVSTSAGAPSGTPTTYTGRAPIHVDTTNNNFYFYSGGSWRTPSGSSQPFVDSTALVKGSSDATKLLAFEVDGLTTGTTRTLTPQDASYTIAGTNLAQTFSSLQTFSSSATISNTWDGSSTTPAGLIFADNGGATNDVFIGRDSSSNIVFNTSSGSSLSFRTAGVERLSISDAGLSLGSIALTGTGAVSAITGVVFSNGGGTANDVGIWRDSGDGASVFYHAGSVGSHKLTVGDTVVLEIDPSSTADDTRLRLWDVTAGSLKRVTRGAADSGGTGFRCLRIAN